MDKLYEHLDDGIRDEIVGMPALSEATEFYARLGCRADYMFGYPAHNYPISPLTQYLILMHYTSPFSNNCGDIAERGNYSMDTKDVEKRIVGLYAEKFGMGEDYWGYVTSGGSESNSCGIALAFSKYPEGILYFSRASHYSVEKGAALHRYVSIPTLGNDIMDVDALLVEIRDNYSALGAPANIVLTHGTTKYGACDDIDRIVSALRKYKIPHYIHVDAALFGGIQNNQKDAPIITDLKARGVDSISVSLHKYVGFPDVKSVFVATEKPRGRRIAYIGQNDTTVSGSRSIPAYALLNHVTEQLAESNAELYSDNIIFFEGLLKDSGIDFYRAPLSNIFVIDAPPDPVSRKFQLSCFDEQIDGERVQKAHIIIFPSHKREIMTELVSALKGDLAVAQEK